LRESKTKDKLEEEFEAEMPQDVSKKAAWLWLFFGIFMLPIASILMVKGASNIASMLGMSEVMVGLTIVALGTSLPELSATIACMRKSEHDLALGNIVGSNMFNLLGVLGISASIESFKLPDDFLSTDYLVMLDLTFALLIFSLIYVAKGKPIPRAIGYLFVICYCAFNYWLYLRL
jgi:cation:H+ antiporter